MKEIYEDEIGKYIKKKNSNMLSREEILNKYSKLDLIHLDYGVQYVPISNNID